METKKKVKYEFYRYDSSPTAGFTKNLVLGTPNEIYFYVVSANPSRVLINNIWTLNSIKQFTLGTGNFDYQLCLKNNENEIDTTDYNINIVTFNTTVYVKVKYLVD